MRLWQSVVLPARWPEPARSKDGVRAPEVIAGDVDMSPVPTALARAPANRYFPALFQEIVRGRLGPVVKSAGGASGAAVSSIHGVLAQPKADRCAPTSCVTTNGTGSAIACQVGPVRSVSQRLTTGASWML